MPLWTQHVLVLLIAAGTAFVLLRQGIQAFRGRGNKLGSCCAKGVTPSSKRPVRPKSDCRSSPSSP